MTNPIIMPAHDADMPSLAQMEQELFPFPVSETALVQWYHMNSVLLRTAWYSNSLAGYLAASFVQDESELYRVGIRTLFQRQGIGQTLMEHYFDICRVSGIRISFLEVHENNHAAYSLYLSLGYTQYDRRVAYYKDSAAALCMKKDIRT